VLLPTIKDISFLIFRRKTSTLISTQQTGRYGSNHWFRLNLDLQQKHILVEPMHAIKVNNIPTSNLSTGGGILNLQLCIAF
jgi:uncharacterized protein YcnI